MAQERTPKHERSLIKEESKATSWEGTRKARDLGGDGRCVVGTSSTTLPSIDIVVEAAPMHSPRKTPFDASPTS